MTVNSSRNIVAFLAAVLAFAACTANAVYSHYQPIDDEGWQSNDTIRFQTAPVAHTGVYSEELCLRTNSKYPFMQLSMVVHQEATPSHYESTDTIVVSMTDGEGIVLGEGIYHYLYRVPLKNVNLCQGDTLTVTVQHNMRRQMLEGVTDVGLTVRAN